MSERSIAHKEKDILDFRDFSVGYCGISVTGQNFGNF